MGDIYTLGHRIPRAPEWGLQIWVPLKGELVTLKNRIFWGPGHHRVCGPCGVSFIQGTGGFLRVQRVGRVGGPVISTSRTILVSVN